MRHLNCRQEREINRKVRETCANKAAAMVYMDRKLGRKPRIRETCANKSAAMVYMDRKLGRKPRIRESAKRISVR